MKSCKKISLITAFILTTLSNVSHAEEYSGFVSQVLTGPSSSVTFNMALVGMSSTDGGAVNRYLFTSDNTYLNMIVNASVNHRKLSITFTSGTVEGVFYR